MDIVKQNSLLKLSMDLRIKDKNPNKNIYFFSDSPK
jgi:hypothetical protein